MEFQEIAITSAQNTPENGYGKNRVQPNLPDVFAKFYGLQYFPSFDESGGKDFNGPVYSKRIKVWTFVIFRHFPNQYNVIMIIFGKLRCPKQLYTFFFRFKSKQF